jgi:translation initiation factor IF-2
METQETNILHFPPVVAVLGHVDHGKTSLLDTIRKTSVAEREHGGITQKIGASSIIIDHEGKKRKITFIDTPGHEAFAKMRGRGAQAADIGLLIVSAVDGVQPQTKESISLLKASGIPYIVVLTKIDSDQKNPEKAKQQLTSEEVLLEGFGGDVPVIEVSAKTGANIKELLDLILLVSDMHPATKDINPTSSLKAIVIESKQDPKAGPKASVVIKNGNIKVKDDITTGKVTGRVRSLISDSGAMLNEAGIGEAVEILGFEKTPSVGDIVFSGLESSTQEWEETKKKNEVDEGAISIILVADTLGSLEAIVSSFPEKVHILSKKTGEITSADVLMAKSVGALVLGFNIKIRPDVIKLASTEKVLVKNYTIIYEMLDEIEDVVEGKRLSLLEEVYGTAKVLASFPFDKQIVMGIKVLEGRIAKGDKVRIERGDEVIGEGFINSVRVGKEQISKVEAGSEAGIIVGPPLDFTIGDVIICHN